MTRHLTRAEWMCVLIGHKTGRAHGKGSAGYVRWCSRCQMWIRV